MEALRRAHAVHPITALRTEYSLRTRHVEAEILPTCRELGIGFVAYAPLGRGLLTGRIESPDELDADDFRRHLPRLQSENFALNTQIAEKVREIAEKKGYTPAQLALARGDDIVPIPGTRRTKYLEENLAAVDVELSRDELARIDAQAPPAAGDRYPLAGMTTIDR